MNRAYQTSPLPPTLLVVPSSYYKIRSGHGINDGVGVDQEVNRNSSASRPLPLGSRITGEKGELSYYYTTQSNLSLSNYLSSSMKNSLSIKY